MGGKIILSTIVFIVIFLLWWFLVYIIINGGIEEDSIGLVPVIIFLTIFKYYFLLQLLVYADVIRWVG